MDPESITDFCFEMGMLKRIRHEGWRVMGASEPENVGSHALRAAQIAYFLAHMEGYDKPYEVVTMLVFHDIGECRIGDLHKVASRYVNADEERAVREQVSNLDDAGRDILRLWKETDERSTTAGIIAKDADLLEQAFTGKEYVEKGYQFAQNWIDNVRATLKTPSARKLLDTLVKKDSNDWWQDLKKLD